MKSIKLNNLRSIAYVFFILCSINSYSQNTDSIFLRTQESYLKILFDSIPKCNNDSAKSIINNSIIDSLEKELSFNYPFDSLKQIGKIKSSDNKIRLITWNIPQADASQCYFGFIQVKLDKEGKWNVYKLNNNAKQTSSDITQLSLNSNSWLGALYYDIISANIKKKNYYILLGVHYNGFFTNKKIIETLDISDNENPKFGIPILELGKHPQNRIVFEYNIYATMMLKYDVQYKMIVFDHLSPSAPMYNGNYRYYGPDFSYDGLKYDKGKEKWMLIQNINYYKQGK
jgi:hypothetical protein